MLMQILNTNQGYNFSNCIKPWPNIVSQTFPALCVKHDCLFGHNGKHIFIVSKTFFCHKQKSVCQACICVVAKPTNFVLEKKL